MSRRRDDVNESPRQVRAIMNFEGRTVGLSMVADALSYVAEIPRHQAFDRLYSRYEAGNAQYAIDREEAEELLREEAETVEGLGIFRQDSNLAS